MANRHHRSAWIMGALGLLAVGCSAQAPAGGLAFAARAAAPNHLLTLKPSMATAKDGMAHVSLMVKVRDAAGDRHTLALPGTNDANGNRFTNVRIVLDDPTHTLTSKATAGDIAYSGATWSYSVATSSWVTNTPQKLPPVRPGTYNVSAYIQRAGGAIQTMRLGGAGTRAGQALQAGDNPMTFTLDLNDNEGTYSFIDGSSTANNTLVGNNMVEGDTIDVDTGVKANMTGVSKINAYIYGNCYLDGAGNPTNAAGRVLLTSLTTAGSWNKFTWNTNNDTAGFLAARFKGPATGTGFNTGTIDIEALGTDGVLLGQASFAINVYGRGSTTLQLQ